MIQMKFKGPFITSVVILIITSKMNKAFGYSIYIPFQTYIRSCIKEKQL